MYFSRLAFSAGDLGPGDMFFGAVPAPFGFGLWTAHVAPTMLGAPTVVLPRFEAGAMIKLIDEHRVTVLCAVSTQFRMMLKSEVTADLSSLRVMFTGGEAIPYDTAATFEERTGAVVLNFFGSNESGAFSRTTKDDSREHRLSTGGRVIPEMDVRLFDDAGNDVTATGGPGQPGGKGPLLCAGYYDDAAANAQLYTQDGYLLMGDLVTIDGDGYLRLVGRKSDIIIRGGKNISAPAVEAEVVAHPAVAVAAAVAMPDEVFGERVCLYAELEPGATLDLDGLVAFLREQGVSPEWFPERLVVLDALPRASGGKIAKGELRADIRRRES
jgi:acyl-CoA synthetase